MYNFKVGVWYMNEYDAARPKFRTSNEPDTIAKKVQSDKSPSKVNPIEFPKTEKSETRKDYTLMFDDPNDDIMREIQEQEEFDKNTDEF